MHMYVDIMMLMTQVIPNFLCVCRDRCRPSGLCGLGAEVPGRAPRGPAGVRVVPQGAPQGGPAAHDPAPAATDRRPGRAGLPAPASPTVRPPPQTAAGDAGRQSLKVSCLSPL